MNGSHRKDMKHKIFYDKRQKLLDSIIRFSTLAAICEVLHCQPGNILEYALEPPEENA